MYSDEITGIVLDIGSSTCRAGYSGEDTPKQVIPSAVGYIPRQKQQQKKGEILLEKPQHQGKGDYYVGDTAVSYRRDNMEIINTFWRGKYTDFEAALSLYKYIFENGLRVQSSQYPLLVSEPSVHIKEQRQKLCEMSFESLQVPAYFTCKAGVLSCFASGRSTSLILECGGSSSYAVPIHDGYVLQKNVLKYDVGGDTITEKLLQHIEKDLKIQITPRYQFTCSIDNYGKKIAEYHDIPPYTHNTFHLYSKLDIARDIKEHICKIVEDTENLLINNTNNTNNEKNEYELPDGTLIKFNEARYKIPELLFSNGGLVPDSNDTNEIFGFKGLHHMVQDSISKCDIDLRKELLSNIIVTGGNSLLNGLVDKLQKKILDITPQNTKVKLIAYPLPIERKFSSWIGGSILSSLGSFQSVWITKAEYDEHGSYVVEKKCP